MWTNRLLVISLDKRFYFYFFNFISLILTYHIFLPPCLAKGNLAIAQLTLHFPITMSLRPDTHSSTHHIPIQRIQHTHFLRRFLSGFAEGFDKLMTTGMNARARLILNGSFLPFVVMSSTHVTSLTESAMHLTCPSAEFLRWTESGLSHTRTPTCLHSNELLEAKAKSEGGGGG